MTVKPSFGSAGDIPQQMTDSALEAVLRRDRLIVAGALAIVVALAWSYVLWLPTTRTWAAWT